MHPLVRNLYKRVLVVGRDYPSGMEHVKKCWKKSLYDPKNCPSCYKLQNLIASQQKGNNNDNDSKNNSENNKNHNNSVTSEHHHHQYQDDDIDIEKLQKQCHEEILFAVNRGRVMVKEMIGIIQLKKYRTMKQRYDSTNNQNEMEVAMKKLENK